MTKCIDMPEGINLIIMKDGTVYEREEEQTEEEE